MKNVVFPVCFDFHTPAAKARAPAVDPFQLMQQILRRGFQYMEFVGLSESLGPIAKRNQFGAHVPVEEDSDFMLQHYEDIESVFADGSYRNLYLFLNDGALELNTQFDETKAAIEVISCPGLTRHNMAREIIHVTHQNFLMAWRRVASDIISAANPVTAG